MYPTKFGGIFTPYSGIITLIWSIFSTVRRTISIKFGRGTYSDLNLEWPFSGVWLTIIVFVTKS